jgi:hypothetical protein
MGNIYKRCAHSNISERMGMEVLGWPFGPVICHGEIHDP